MAAALSFGFAPSLRTQSTDMNRPKIRALTAFINFDPAHYQDQVASTVASLQRIKAIFEKAGFQVQTLRLTTQPFPTYTRNLSDDRALAFFKEFDRLAAKDGLDVSIGPAMMRSGDDPREARLLSHILASTQILEGTIVIASNDGIHEDGIREATSLMHYVADNTASSLGNFRFAAIAMVPPGAPFYPASYHINADHTFAIGLESASVVAAAMSSTTDPERAQMNIEEALGKWAAQLEFIGKQASQDSGWKFTGIDLSPAPLKDVSIGAAIEGFTHEPLGSSGTLAAVAIITRALAKIPVTRVGYSGLMLPVLEDSVIAQRWSEGRLSLSSLLLYSSVCGIGLDVAPLPGDTSEAQLSAILRDVASLAFKWHKPLSARLLPVKGKKVGDRTDFQDPFLVNATIQAVP
ncbi:MAG TPA: DUF711 family protein [Candidatus Acidoferrales bacterium]|nr:DUF711 family protein [Candidatus Acidoferrales bacterium]